METQGSFLQQPLRSISTPHLRLQTHSPGPSPRRPRGRHRAESVAGTRPASVDCCPHCSVSPLLLLAGSFSIPEPPSSLALEVLPHLLPASSQQTTWRPRRKGALLLLRVSSATPALLVILPRLHTCPVFHLCHHGMQNTLMFSDVLKVLSTCCGCVVNL